MTEVHNVDFPFLFGVCSFVLILTGLWKFSTKQYAMAIFNLIWGLLFFICIQDVAEQVSAETVKIMLIMIVCVNIAYSLGNIGFKTKNKNKNAVYKCNYDLLRILLFLSFAIMMYYCVATVIKYGLNLNAIREMNNSDSESKVFEGLFDTLVFYGFAVPMVYVGSLAVTYNVSQKLRIPKSVIGLLGLNILAYIITVGGRTLLMRIIMFAVAAVLWKLHELGFKKMKIGRLLVYALIIYLFMNLITALRNTYSITFIEQALRYFRGAILHLDYNLEHTVREANYYGYVTYGGFFYYPVKVLKTLLGTEWLTSNEIMAFLQVYKQFFLGGRGMYYNALLPNAYYYYYDMGYVGVVLFSTFLGLAARKGERAYKHPTFGKFILWATAVFAVTYSVLGGVLWNFTYPTSLIYCFLLSSLLYKKVGKYEQIN